MQACTNSFQCSIAVTLFCKAYEYVQNSLSWLSSVRTLKCTYQCCIPCSLQPEACQVDWHLVQEMNLELERSRRPKLCKYFSKRGVKCVNVTSLCDQQFCSPVKHLTFLGQILPQLRIHRTVLYQSSYKFDECACEHILRSLVLLFGHSP